MSNDNGNGAPVDPLQQLAAGLNTFLMAPLQLFSSMVNGSAQAQMGQSSQTEAAESTTQRQPQQRYDYPYAQTPGYHRRPGQQRAEDAQAQQAPSGLTPRGSRGSGNGSSQGTSPRSGRSRQSALF